MSTSEDRPTASTSERLLAERLEEVTARIRNGEPVDLAIYEQEDRRRAEELRRLVDVAIIAMAAMPSRPSSALEDCSEAWPQDPQGRAAAVDPAPAASESSGRSQLASPLPQVRGYEVLELIGAGGMARVYRARDLGSGQLVAVKMLHPERLGNPANIHRFKREASRSNQLHHPLIVRILDTALEAQPPYFCMQLVEGQGLNRCLERFVRDPREAARVVKSIAETVQYANERGILHRDLKPHNVILDEQGQPHLTDFGLARAEDDTELTRTHDILGTPAYMAPEQAAGTPRDVTNRTDVYGVGAILYALTTGHAPFESDSPQELLWIVQNRRPRDPSNLNGRVGSDLATICMKCLEKRQSRRYESAAAVAEELGRFLDGKPILARPPNAPTHAFRWVQDHPRAVATGILGLLVLCVMFWQRSRRLEAEAAARGAELAKARAEVRSRELDIAKAKSEAAAQAAELARAKAEARAREAQIRERGEASRRSESEVRELVSNPTAGSRWVVLERIRRAVALAPPASDLAELRSLAATTVGRVDLRRLKDLDLGTDLLDRVASRRSTNCLAYDARGGRVAIGQEHGAGAVFVRVYDTRTEKKLSECPIIHGGRTSQGGVRALVFSPDSDGHLLAAGLRDGRVSIWDSRRAEPVLLDGDQQDEVTCLAFTSDGKRLISGPHGQTLRIWDLAAPKPTAIVVEVGIKVRSLSLGVGDSRLACAGSERLKVLDVSTIIADPARPKVVGELGGSFTQARFGPDGRFLAASEPRRIVLIDVQGGRFEPFRSFSDPELSPEQNGALQQLRFSPDGSLLVSGSANGRVIVWEAASGRVLASATVRDVGSVFPAFSPDGKTLAVANTDGVALFEVALPDEQVVGAHHSHPVRSFAFSRRGEKPGWLACLAADQRIDNGTVGEVTVWSLNDGRLRRRLDLSVPQDGEASVPALAIHPDQPVVAFGRPGAIELWDFDGPGSQRLIAEGSATALNFTPDGTLLCGVFGQNRVRSWSYPTIVAGARWELDFRTKLVINQAASLCAAFGRRSALVGTRVPSVILLDVREAKQKRLWGAKSPVHSVALSRDGSLAAWGTQEGRLVVTHTASEKPVADLEAHRDLIYSMDFSPDGKLLATSSRDRTWSLWSVSGSNGIEKRLTLNSPTGRPAIQVRFSHDGRTLGMVLQNECAVRLWRLDRLRSSLKDLGLGWD